MKRSTIGSLLFIGGTLVFLLAPSAESSAQGGDGKSAQDLDGPHRPVVIAPGITPPMTTAPNSVVATNAGLKGVTAPPPELGNAGPSGNCGDNQVEVDGDYCPALEQKCIRWMDPETTIPRRCSEFAPTGKCQGKTIKKHFCIDKYEYPNKVGE